MILVHKIPLLKTSSASILNTCEADMRFDPPFMEVHSWLQDYTEYYKKEHEFTPSELVAVYIYVTATHGAKKKKGLLHSL